MTTAAAIIDRAAEINGYKDPGEPLSGDETTSFLAVLNSMVDAWTADPLYVYAATMLTQTISGNPVTIGDGATLDTPRPVRIPAGGFFRSGSNDYAFEVITREQYDAFMVKSISTPWPRYCYYEPGVAMGSLYFFPALAATGELHLPIEQRLIEFADLTTDYVLMPGARAALEYSLAEELPGKVTQKIERLAMKYRRAIEHFEAPILTTGMDRMHGNILAGWQ